MKVLHLISSCGYYGAEAVMVTLAQALRAEGVDISIGLLQTPSRGFHEMADKVRSEHLPLHLIPCNGKWDRVAVRKIRTIVQTGAIDLVHGHGYKADLFGFLATRKTATKRIATCHDSGLTKGFRWSAASSMDVYTSLHKFILRRFDRVAAVSRPIADALVQAGVQAERVRTIDNGIDLQRFASATPASDLLAFKGGAPLIGLVGRLAEGKGHDVLLRTAKELVANALLPKFIFIGDGPLEAELQRLTAELGLTSSVRFAGKRTDMASVYAALDVFALPSENEGMPISVLEAMASKTPVIASSVGAIPRLITDHRTGLLIALGDVAGLQHAVAELLTSPGLRTQIADNAFSFVREHYSAEAMAFKYVQMYAEALPQSAPTSPSIASASANSI